MVLKYLMWTSSKDDVNLQSLGFLLPLSTPLLFLLESGRVLCPIADGTHPGRLGRVPATHRQLNVFLAHFSQERKSGLLGG